MRKKILLLFLIAGTIFLTAGITMAFMFNSTSELLSRFTPARVTCLTNHADSETVTVTNTGNIKAYIRVRVISYWQDADGNIVGKTSEIPTLEIGNGWLSGEDDTYYYPLSVAPSDDTPNMLTAGYTPETDTYNGTTVYQMIEFLAEAVQAEPNDAVVEAWGVTLNEAKIESVP